MTNYQVTFNLQNGDCVPVSDENKSYTEDLNAAIELFNKTNVSDCEDAIEVELRKIVDNEIEDFEADELPKDFRVDFPVGGWITKNNGEWFKTGTEL